MGARKSCFYAFDTRRVQSQCTRTHMCNDVGKVVVLHRLADNKVFGRVDGVLLPSEKLVYTRATIRGIQAKSSTALQFPRCNGNMPSHIMCQKTAPPEIRHPPARSVLRISTKYHARTSSTWYIEPNVDDCSTTLSVPHRVPHSGLPPSRVYAA